MRISGSPARLHSVSADFGFEFQGLVESEKVAVAPEDIYWPYQESLRASEAGGPSVEEGGRLSDGQFESVYEGGIERFGILRILQGQLKISLDPMTIRRFVH